MRYLYVFVVLGLFSACGTDSPPDRPASAAPGGEIGSTPSAVLEIEGVPPPPPPEWLPYIGEFAAGADTLSLLEEGGSLFLWQWREERTVLRPSGDGRFEMAGSEEVVTIHLGDAGEDDELTLGGRTFPRLRLGGEAGETFTITPLRPPGELRVEALSATPPVESGEFLPPDLVEVALLDPAIKLDIRYATTNNFMGEVFYATPQAFLQRPAAEAVVRANQWLMDRGYGLLIHDGYRPWYVTKMFWDATPVTLRTFVADPSQGSRHNRGCAVDLTLYDLETGDPVVMPGGYDEMSPRSYPDYPGGTSAQRWLRELLREAMEAEGFSVYEAEWWHFDFEDWRSYRIGNQRFHEIGSE